MSQTGAFELLGSRLGLGPKSRAAYVAIDLGLRQPTEAEEKVLADWLGGYPSDELMAASGSDTTIGPDVAAYLARIDSLVELVGKLVEQNAVLIAGRSPAPVYDPDQERADVQAAESALATEQAGTTPTPRTDGPRRNGGSRRTAPEGGQR